MHPALTLQPDDGFSYLAMRKLFYHLFQLWVFLAHDLIKLHRLHACFLKLSEDATCFDRFMLTCIANEQHAVIRVKSSQELVHLFCRCERRFIEYVQAVLAGIRPLPLHQVHLQGGSLDPCFT